MRNFIADIGAVALVCSSIAGFVGFVLLDTLTLHYFTDCRRALRRNSRKD